MRVKEQLEVLLNDNCNERAVGGTEKLKRSNLSKSARLKRSSAAGVKGNSNLSNSNSSRETFSSLDDLSSISDYSYDSSSSVECSNSREISAGLVPPSFSNAIDAPVKSEEGVWKFSSEDFHSPLFQPSSQDKASSGSSEGTVDPSVLAQIEVSLSKSS